MSKIQTPILALILTVMTLSPGSMNSQTSGSSREIMRTKLHHMHRILDALVSEDFYTAARSGDRLADLSQLTPQRLRSSPDYEHYSSEFYRLAQELAQAARDRDYDAATQAYLEAGQTCFQCHKYLRNTQRNP